MTTLFAKPCAPLSGPVLWALLTTASFIFSPMAHAVGLGNHHVRSALGQPLKVAIDVVSNTKSSVSTTCFNVLRDTSTSPDGIPFVTQGSLSIEGKGKASRLVFTSTRPTNDPVVKLGIETTCGQRARREFTLILDPQQPNEGKEIPLPFAPAATGLNGQLPAPSSSSSSLPGTSVPVPSKKAVTPAPSVPTVSAPASTEALPGSLTAKELENLEKAIRSGSSAPIATTPKTDASQPASSGNEAGNEKKKPSAPEVATASNPKSKNEAKNQALSSTLAHGAKAVADDNNDVQLSISEGEQGAITSEQIQPKLNMITELSPVENPSMGQGGLSEEERAAILAKVERVVNAPLEHDLPKDPAAVEETVNAAIPSSYERVIQERTAELQRQLDEANAARQRNYWVAGALGAASLLLLGLWWRTRKVAYYNSAASSDRFADQKKKDKPTLAPSDSTGTWVTDPSTTSPDDYPGAPQHTVTFEYESDKGKPDQSAKTAPHPTTATDSRTDVDFASDPLLSKPAQPEPEPVSSPPTFVSAFAPLPEEKPLPSETASTKPELTKTQPDPLVFAEPEIPFTPVSDVSTDDSPTSESNDVVTKTEPTQPFFTSAFEKTDTPATSALASASAATSSAPVKPYENPFTVLAQPVSKTEIANPFALLKSTAESPATHALDPISRTHLPSSLANDPLLMQAPSATESSQPDSTNTSLHSAVAPLIDVPILDKIDNVERELIHTMNGNAGILVQGQTVVDQATQYLHAEQSDVAYSYLESSIEWLATAPQPWLMLLRLHATRHDGPLFFDTLQTRFLEQFQGVKPFSRDDLLRQPEVAQSEHHHAALEQCAPELLNQLMNDWNDSVKVKHQLETILIHDLQSPPERFSIEALQELLFLYNLISIKATQK